MRTQTSRAVSVLRASLVAVVLALALTAGAVATAGVGARPAGPTQDVAAVQPDHGSAAVALQESPGSEGNPTPEDTQQNAGAQKNPGGWTILLYAGLAALVVTVVAVLARSRRREGGDRPDAR